MHWLYCRAINAFSVHPGWVGDIGPQKMGASTLLGMALALYGLIRVSVNFLLHAGIGR